MFGWKDLLAGLDGGLDVAKTIASVIPGGQGIAAGLSALDVVVSKANETYGKKLPEPIQASLSILEGIVQSKDNGSGVKIDNMAALSILEVIAKSSGNALDDRIICIIKAYIGCNGQEVTDIEFGKSISLQPKIKNEDYAQLLPQTPNESAKTDRHLEIKKRELQLENLINSLTTPPLVESSLFSWPNNQTTSNHLEDIENVNTNHIRKEEDDEFKISSRELINILSY